MKATLTRAQVWTMPLLLGGISITGLLTALISDDLGDVISWITLNIPIAVTVWYVIRYS